MRVFVLHKLKNFFVKMYRAFVSAASSSVARVNPNIRIGKCCFIDRLVRLRATDGGSITVGNNVSFSLGAQLTAKGGIIHIEDNVIVGAGTVIVAQESIVIGRDTMIAEYVVIRDQDHATNTSPYSKAGYITTAIIIGANVWIACKATVLRGSVIGDNAVVGAHGLVNGNIDEGMLAVGVPARSIKRL